MFICSECGFESRQWLGKCPDCGQWNTLENRKESVSSSNSKNQNYNLATPIIKLDAHEEIRFSSHIEELDNVLGGGFVKGSIVLIGGQPGIGKSTLLLQTADKVSRDKKVLYVTAEESEFQVKYRAERLNVKGENLFLISESSLSGIIYNLENLKPDLVIIDSIQTIKSENIASIPGTIGQIRECASVISEFAKKNNITAVIVAQINKEGTIAGPKHLEHLVDTVLYFEESRDLSLRILRASKNRFGASDELGIFEMTSQGLTQLAEHVLVRELRNTPGLSLAVSMEGIRPLVTEVQALVTETGFAMPQRMSEGFDRNRMLFLLAVMEKKAGVFFRNQDVFVNIPGAVKISDPACELSVCCAILSSLMNKTINSSEYIFLGEIGLTGEIRRITFPEKRFAESIRLGVKNIVTGHPAKGQKKDKQTNCNFIYVNSIEEVMDRFFR